MKEYIAEMRITKTVEVLVKGDNHEDAWLNANGGKYEELTTMEVVDWEVINIEENT